MAAKKAKAATVAAESSSNTSPVFSKEQLLSSKRFQDRKDVLNVLLASGEVYTVAAAEQLIEEYYKKEVK